MSNRQNRLNNLARCKYAFKKQRKDYERMLELCEKAQDTLFELSFDTTFYKTGETRVYATEFRKHTLCILINNEVISFDLGNKTAISKTIDRVSDKDFKEYIRKVKELYV